MAVGRLEGPDWRDFLAAYARLLRNARKRAFRWSSGLSNTLTAREQEVEARDEATLREYMKLYPDHAEARELFADMEILRGMGLG